MNRRLATIVGSVLVFAIAAAALIGRLPRVREWVIHLGDHSVMMPWAMFGAIQIGVAAFGFLPASLMAVAAGATYGMVQGTLISAIGTMLGGWLAFLLSRSILRPWIAKIVARFPASSRLDAAVATEGWRFVCLMRVSPVMPFAATSYGLGLTRIGQRDYLLGTLASLPALVGYVSLGAFGRAGLALGQGQAGPLQWLLPLVGILTVLIAVLRLRKLARSAPKELVATT